MHGLDGQARAQVVGNRRRSQTSRELDVVVVNYNGAKTVVPTIESIFAQRDVKLRLIVVDDGSTDGSPDAIVQRFPEVEMHCEPRNTKDVNRLRNIGLARAQADRVVVCDNDVTFDRGCFAELLRAMDADRRVAICIPRMMYADDPGTIYMAGGKMHYAGATIAPKRHEPFDGEIEPRAAIGGGIALLDRDKLATVGNFDPSYRLAWGDDVELHQRLLLAGYTSLYVPTAVCLHDYKPFDSRRSYRARGQVGNRWRYMLTHYEARTLLLIAPALLLYELTQAAFLTLKGMPHLYAGGTLDALRTLPESFRRRHEVQALRKVPDRSVLFAGPLYVRPEHAVGRRGAARAVNMLSRVLDMYWRAVRPLMSRDPTRPRRRLAAERRGAASHRPP